MLEVIDFLSIIPFLAFKFGISGVQVFSGLLFYEVFFLNKLSQNVLVYYVTLTTRFISLLINTHFLKRLTY